MWVNKHVKPAKGKRIKDSIPRYTKGSRQTTKGGMYKYLDPTLSSDYYKWHYILSRIEILQALKDNDLIKLDMNTLEYLWKK